MLNRVQGWITRKNRRSLVLSLHVLRVLSTYFALFRIHTHNLALVLLELQNTKGILLLCFRSNLYPRSGTRKSVGKRFPTLNLFHSYNTCVAHASSLPRDSCLLTAASITLLSRHTTRHTTRHADVSSSRVRALTLRFSGRRRCTLTSIPAN